MSLNRTIRISALVVLLVSAVQIGMCALDCDCFLPSARGIASRSLNDADGCVCCARCGHVTTLMNVPGLVAADFTPSDPSLHVVVVDISLPDHPPRS